MAGGKITSKLRQDIEVEKMPKPQITFPETASAPAIMSVEKKKTFLAIGWSNGEQSIFHYIWLRDNCFCDLCGDCYSSLRRYVPSGAGIDIEPDDVSFTADALSIVWAGDGHVSTYTASWLSANRYDDAARKARRQPVHRWDQSTPAESLSFDFTAVGQDPALHLAMQRQLISHGIVVVTGGPDQPGSVTSFAELFGEVVQSSYGAVFDLSPSNAIGTAGTTLREVPPHSDEPFVYSPPGIEALACVRPAEDGGDSVMVDGFGIAEKLRKSNPAGFDLLAKWNHHFVRHHPKELNLRAYAPVIALDDDGEISGIRIHTRASGPMDLPETIMEDYLAAYHQLCDLMMAPENQVRLRLNAGDAVIFDNHRALHARSSFSDRRRFMQICGVTREKFHERFRMLSAELGDDQSANMVLRAGACR